MADVLVLAAGRARAREIRGLLVQDAHQVAVCPSVAGWRERERQLGPEVVVAAIDSLDEVLAEAGPPARGFPPPLLFVPSQGEHSARLDLDDRLIDCLASPFLQEELLARVDALARVRGVVLRGSAAPTGRAGAGAARTFGRRLAGLLRSRIPRREKPLVHYLEVAARVAQWSERRDAFEPGHAERVTSLCATMAEGLGLGDEETATLLRAAMLHDIGKAALPVEVLHQRAPLSDAQRRMIRMHPRRGASLLRALDSDQAVADAILYHHERPDGGGYYGRSGQQIPLAARMLAVAEVYDAMTSSRVREPLAPEQALERLAECRGAHLDGDCVDALIERLRPRPRSVELSPRDPTLPF